MTTRGLLPRCVLFQSKKLLLWLGLGFALLQACLAYLVEHTPQVRDPEVSEKLEQLTSRLRERPNVPLVLALGSSRTAMAVDARSLSESNPGALVFNLAIPGGGPVLHNVMLERVLERGIRPAMIYLEIMPIMFVTRHGQLAEADLLNSARLRRDELWACDLFRQPWRQACAYYLGRLLPCYLHQAELRQFLLGDGIRRFTDFGWRVPPDHSSAECCAGMLALAQSQYRKYCVCSTPAAEPRAALGRFIERCRALNIPVRLILMPEGSSFRGLYSPEAWQLQDRLIETFRSDWQLEVIDARLWVADADFWDGHHVLQPGAATFTARFERESLRPALRALPGTRP